MTHTETTAPSRHTTCRTCGRIQGYDGHPYAPCTPTVRKVTPRAYSTFPLSPLSDPTVLDRLGEAERRGQLISERLREQDDTFPHSEDGEAQRAWWAAHPAYDRWTRRTIDARDSIARRMGVGQYAELPPSAPGWDA